MGRFRNREDGPRRILIVAHKTIATPGLVKTIRQRTEQGPCTFTLLIPDSRDQASTAWTLRYARKMLSREVGVPIDGVVAEGEDAFAGVMQAVRAGEYDEIVISLLAGPDSRWMDLPGRAESLGVPITVVLPDTAPAEH